jgi:hypothetical protein
MPVSYVMSGPRLTCHRGECLFDREIREAIAFHVSQTKPIRIRGCVRFHIARDRSAASEYAAPPIVRLAKREVGIVPGLSDAPIGPAITPGPLKPNRPPLNFRAT